MRILLIAFEGEGYLSGQLALRLKAEGHAIRILNCDHYTVTHAPEVYAYYARIGLAPDEFSHMGDVFSAINAFPETLSEQEVDNAYIRDFEQRYCKSRTIHDLVTTDTLLSQTFHSRSVYYHPQNKNIFYKYLELILKKVEETVVEGRFDLMFSVYNQYFVKALIFQVAQAQGVPHLTLTPARIENLCLLVDNFGEGTPADVVKEMQRLQESGDACEQAAKYITSITDTVRHPYDSFAKTMSRAQANAEWDQRLKAIWQFARYTIRPRMRTWTRYRSFPKQDYFLPSWRELLRLTTVSSLRSIAYRRDESLNEHKLPEGPFLYFAMHLIPESSTLTVSATLDELECIYQVSKVLPMGWKIVVKANPNMFSGLDTHPNSYYRRIRGIANVVVVDPFLPSSEVVKACSAVASLAGTALLEGVMHGKPGFRWGNPEFTAVPGIHVFDPRTFVEQLGQRPSDGVKYYVQGCMNLGLRLDLPLLIGTQDKNIEKDDYRQMVERILAGIRARLPVRAA